MIAAIVNGLAIIAGSILGVFGKRLLSEKMSETVFNGLSLCVIGVGISGMIEVQNTLIVIISIVLGALIGEAIDIDLRFQKLSVWVEDQFRKKSGQKDVSVAEGFLTASLIFCTGAMAIVGSLEAGLTHDYSIIFAKSMIDGIMAAIYASTMGIGVLFSSFAVFVYQGLITLFSGVLKPLLNDVIIHEMSATGGLLIFALGLNMLKITKIKVANYIPAIFMPIIIYLVIKIF